MQGLRPCKAQFFPITALAQSLEVQEQGDSSISRTKAEAMRSFLKNGTHLLPIARIERVDYSRIEELILVVEHDDTRTTIEGIDAFEAAMVLNPACLEGQRLRWARHAWLIHNCLGHPLMQLLALLGKGRLGLWVHDITVPKPRGLRHHV